MTNHTLTPEMLALKDFSIECRHALHRIPEPSGQEFKTSAFCREKMESMGYSIQTYAGFTGFIADLMVDPAFKLIGIRADMDGLKCLI